MEAHDTEAQDRLFSGCARVVVARGDSPSCEYLFRKRVTIGRNEDNAIRIRESSVSGSHAAIEWSDGAFWIRDRGSKNGVYVNGERVTERVLAPEDRIQLGMALLVFLRDGPDGEVPVSAPTSRGPAADDAPAPGATLVVEPGADTMPGLSSGGPLELMSRIMSVLESLTEDPDLERFYERLLVEVMEVIPAQRGVILLIEDGELVIRGSHVTGDRDSKGAVRVPRSVTSQVLARRAGVAASDVAADPELGQQQSIILGGITSLLAVPIHSGGQIGGVLYLDTSSDIGQLDVRALPSLLVAGRAVGMARSLAERAREGPPRSADARPRTVDGALLRVTVRAPDGGGMSAESIVAWLEALHRRFAGAVTANSGRVEGIGGRELHAVFGFPDAAGMDSLRPVHAGLRILRESAWLNLRTSLVGGPAVDVVAALEAGPVTVGTARIGRDERLITVSGLTPRLERLVTAALPGELALGPQALALWGARLERGRELADAGGSTVLGLASAPPIVGGLTRRQRVLPVAVMSVQEFFAAENEGDDAASPTAAGRMKIVGSARPGTPLTGQLLVHHRAMHEPDWHGGLELQVEAGPENRVLSPRELVRVMPQLGTAATDNSILARVQAVEPRTAPDGRAVSYCTLVPERPLAARES